MPVNDKKRAYGAKLVSYIENYKVRTNSHIPTFAVVIASLGDITTFCSATRLSLVPGGLRGNLRQCGVHADAADPRGPPRQWRCADGKERKLPCGHMK